MRSLALTLPVLFTLALSGAVAAPAATYQVDPVHSLVQFRARHFGVSNVYGRFNDFKATVVYDEANPAAGSFELEVQTNSVDTGTGRRDDHLRSPDFFNVKQFPVMTFKSTSIKPLGDGRFEVTGDLTILGKTQPVTSEVRLIGTGKHPGSNAPMVGFETELNIKRSDYGMAFMVGPIGDEIGVLVAVEASAQSAEQ